MIMTDTAKAIFSICLHFILIALYVLLVSTPFFVFTLIEVEFYDSSAIWYYVLDWLMSLTHLLPTLAYFIFFKFVAKSPKEIKNVI